MDINGARELARRFGPQARPQREPFSAGAVSEVALPVFHWFGIEQPAGRRPEPKPAVDQPAPSDGRRSGRFSLRRG